MKKVFRLDPFSKTPWPFCEEHGAMTFDTKTGSFERFWCDNCKREVSYDDIHGLVDIRIPGIRTGTKEEWEASQPRYNIEKTGEASGIGDKQGDPYGQRQRNT